MVETPQKLKGKVVTVTFLLKESSLEMKQKPGPEVSIPEVKPEVTSPVVKPAETTTLKVDNVLESEKTPVAELQGDERRQMVETEIVARASLVTVSIRNILTQVAKVTFKKWALGIRSLYNVNNPPLLYMNTNIFEIPAIASKEHILSSKL